MLCLRLLGPYVINSPMIKLTNTAEVNYRMMEQVVLVDDDFRYL
jgi:hypothetical protein